MKTAGKTVPSLRELCTLPRLQSTWRILRKEISKAPVRDCLDYLENDATSYSWLKQIQERLLDGTYRPHPPGRREEAKSNGAYRVITVPAIDDVAVFRHLADYVYRRAKMYEPPGSYFSRRFAFAPIGKKMDRLSDTDYLAFFDVWLRYNYYRKHLGLCDLFKYVVVTDITNYFESIQHTLLLEYLATYGVPREALGVLGKLLDVLRPTAGHSASPSMGLPVDIYDCSRTLAHIFLFEHDRRIAAEVGKSGYIRWMDDQNIGVRSKVEGRRIIRKMVESLASQRLSVNAGKTKILSPKDLAEYFWLESNESLDALETKVAKKTKSSDLLDEFEYLWKRVVSSPKAGHWDKVIKRLYRLGALLKTKCINIKHHQEFLVEAPQLADRIFEYILARGRYREYLRLFLWLLKSGNSLYESVETQWFECLLMASPPNSVKPPLRKLAVEFARGTKRGTRRVGPRVPAALLLYWLWDGRQGRVLETVLSGPAVIDGSTRRTMAAILCARKPAHAEEWLLVGARHASPEVSSLIQLVTALRAGKAIALPRPLVFVKRPPVLGRYTYDARAWLRLELLLLSPRKDVRMAVKKAIRDIRKYPLTPPENDIAKRLERRLMAV